MTTILGLVAMVSTITYLCFGIPVQIYTNYRRKSTEGLSLFMVAFCAATLLLWSVYAYVKTPRDWYIVGSNFPGFISASVLLCQFWRYRKGPPAA